MKVGKKYIVTTDNWFYGKDGKQYRGVFGTLKGVFDDKETLGIITNRNSTNWYAQIGSVRVAGCQIHYVVEADVAPSATVHETTWKDGVKTVEVTPCRVYNADQDDVNGEEYWDYVEKHKNGYVNGFDLEAALKCQTK